MITAKEAREQVDKLMSIENHCKYIDERIREACSRGLIGCDIRTSMLSNLSEPDSLDLLMMFLEEEENRNKLSEHLNTLGYNTSYNIKQHPVAKTNSITLIIRW